MTNKVILAQDQNKEVMGRDYSKGRSPSQQRSIQRVETILNAVLKVVGDSGLSAVSINSIAAEADITPSSMYQYFNNKSEMITALGVRLDGLLVELVNDYGSLSKPKDIADYAISVTKNFRDLIRDTPGWRPILNEYLTPRKGTDEVTRRIMRFAEPFAENINSVLPKEIHQESARICFWWLPLSYSTGITCMLSEDEDYQIQLIANTLTAHIKSLFEIKT